MTPTHGKLKAALKIKPRHKWFSHICRDAENGWDGPHDLIEDAARAALLGLESDGIVCYVAQGYKLTKAEAEDTGADYAWEVDAQNAIEIRIRE